MTPGLPPSPHSSRDTKRPRIDAIGGLRFMAALHIVGFHLLNVGAFDGVTLPGAVRGVLSAGGNTTSLFVLLSGFVLYYGYVNDSGALRVSPRTFWVARFAQTYPVMLLCHLLIAPALLFGRVHYAPGEAAIRGALVVTLLQSWVPGYAFSYDMPAWTISSLAVCYGLFPAIVRAVARLSRRGTVLALVGSWGAALLPAALCMTFVPGIAADTATDQSSFWSAFLHVSPVVWLPIFVSGVLLARLFLSGDLRAARDNPATLAVVALSALVAVSLVRERLPYVLVHTALLLPLYWMLMLSLASGRGPVSRVLATPLLATLGRASLVLYLLHVPLQSYVMYYIHHMWPGESPLVPVLAYLATTLVLSVVLTERLVQPLAARIKERLAPAWRRETITAAPPVTRGEASAAAA